MAYPSHLITETFIIKDMVLMGLTSILNVAITDTFNLLKDIDNRVNNNKLCVVTGLSRQVYSAYIMYLKYLPIIDFNQHNKYDRTYN
jgi:hypothetical protein